MAEINDALGAKEYLTEMRKKFDKTMAPEMKAAMKEAINALSLCIPETPELWGDGYAENEQGESVLVYDQWNCPNCGFTYEYPDGVHNHCPCCGQALNWDAINEEQEDS